ncbi:MAG TPA: MBOAT family protein, partial [Verrucomicrobiae bacterium]|nr:MBOAT family protein [Verrucomicrobiae bacterium]
MLFNSAGYILLFFPIAATIYFFLNRNRLTIAAKASLVLSSLFFYGWWNPKYVILLLVSLLFNYGIGTVLADENQPFRRKLILVVGITCDVLLLGYYKYADFFLTNASYLSGKQLPLLKITLP